METNAPVLLGPFTARQCSPNSITSRLFLNPLFRTYVSTCSARIRITSGSKPQQWTLPRPPLTWRGHIWKLCRPRLFLVSRPPHSLLFPASPTVYVTAKLNYPTHTGFLLCWTHPPLFSFSLTVLCLQFPNSYFLYDSLLWTLDNKFLPMVSKKHPKHTLSKIPAHLPVVGSVFFPFHLSQKSLTWI